MTIESTMTPQARHKPSPQKRLRKDSRPQEPAIVRIASEPAESKQDEGWFYFWAEHVNSKRKDWSILCTEDQISWVIEQMNDNVQLTEGTHFCDKRIKTEDGYITRSVLSDEFYLDEPVDEDEPITWQEVPVLPQDESKPSMSATEPDQRVIDGCIRRARTMHAICQALGIPFNNHDLKESIPNWITSESITYGI